MSATSDILQDSFNEVKQLAEFLGTKADDSLIQAVCEQCNFQNLKTSYEKTKNMFTNNEDPNKYSFRKG